MLHEWPLHLPATVAAAVAAVAAAAADAADAADVVAAGTDPSLSTARHERAESHGLPKTMDVHAPDPAPVSYHGAMQSALQALLSHGRGCGTAVP